MPRSDTPQAALELLILRTLALAPNHGFGIAVRIEQSSTGLLRVEEGSLYPALHRMQKAKLIEAEWRITTNGRRAKIYRLTAAGKRRLKEQERSWAALSEGVRRVLGWA